MRKCPKCKELKPAHEWYKSGSSYCKGCHAEYGREYKQRHPTWERARQLKRAYGLTLADEKEMEAKQKGRCGICQTPKGKKNFCVDHDHKTGKIRGLLCGKCNVGLGKFNDSGLLLLRAVDYLKGGSS